MAELVYWAILLAVLAGAAFAALIGIKAYRSGASPSEVLFRQRPEPRIGVMEHANVDGRRKLLLVRRDDVEHLIMIGGPVDVVIETGIGEKRRPVRSSEPSEKPGTATVFTRPPRAFGQAASRGEPGNGNTGGAESL
ncbi:MAG: flagellar biosynthetic protein FliO [Hyphomicrobium sp.]